MQPMMLKTADANSALDGLRTPEKSRRSRKDLGVVPRDVKGDHGYRMARGDHSRELRVGKAFVRRRAALSERQEQQPGSGRDV
ncbi:hypothetical protein MTO96_027688 [Rhipicephalus appendiculatus]